MEKKPWNIKVRIIIIVIGTVTKGLAQGLEELEIMRLVETVQFTVLLRPAIIRGKSWKLEKTCCHSDSSEKLSPLADVKNSQRVKYYYY